MLIVVVMSDTRFGLRRLLGLALSAACVSVATCHDHWVDIWASMPQEVEPYNLPNAPYVSTSQPPPVPFIGREGSKLYPNSR